MATAYSDDDSTYEYVPPVRYSSVPPSGFWDVRLRIGSYGGAELWPYLRDILNSNLISWEHEPEGDLRNFKVRDDSLGRFIAICPNMLSGELSNEEPSLTILDEWGKPAKLMPREETIAGHTGIYIYIHHSKEDYVVNILDDKCLLGVSYNVYEAPEEKQYRVVVVSIRPTTSRFRLAEELMKLLEECEEPGNLVKLGGETIWDSRAGKIPPNALEAKVYNESRSKRRRNVDARFYKVVNEMMDIVSETPAIVEKAFKMFLGFREQIQKLQPITKVRDNGRVTLSQEYMLLQHEIYTKMSDVRYVGRERKRKYAPQPQRFAQCTIDRDKEGRDCNIDTTTMLYKQGAYKNAKYLPTGIDKKKLQRLLEIRQKFHEHKTNGREWTQAALAHRLFIDRDGRPYKDDKHLHDNLNQYIRRRKSRK